MTEHITIEDQTFYFHACGALFWKEKQMVLVADAHFGKVSHFRKHGSAVPKSAIKKNFDKLNGVIDQFDPGIVCFLGDLFHSSINEEWKLFEKWVKSHNQRKVVLVVGNHDIISPLYYEEIGVHISKEWVINTILLTHHPEERPGLFNLCGHVHPGVLLSGLGRQRLRLPCFFKSPNQLILPAFGNFTGVHILEPSEQDQVYVLAKENVLLVE